MSDQRRLDEALERLAQGKSPKDQVPGLNQDERRMVQMAQALRGSEAEHGPDAAFVSRLSARLTQAEPTGMSRRTAVLGGLGAIAAGVVAGVGLDHAVSPSQEASQIYPVHGEPLVSSSKGRWVRVLHVDEVPEGAVKTFQTESLAGYVFRRKGKLHAYSRVCTHMGCLLVYRDPTNSMVCPCHGAIFGVDGKFKRYPSSGQKLANLPWIRARVRKNWIEVFTA